MKRTFGRDARITAAFVVGSLFLSVCVLIFGHRYSRAQLEDVIRLTQEAKEKLVGRPAPVFWAESSGDTVPVPPPPGRSVVLVFVEAECSACRRLLRALSEVEAPTHGFDGADRFVVVLGPGELADDPRIGMDVTVVRAVHADSTRGRYQINGLPFMTWIDSNSRISHVQVGYHRKQGIGRTLASARK